MVIKECFPKEWLLLKGNLGNKEKKVTRAETREGHSSTGNRKCIDKLTYRVYDTELEQYSGNRVRQEAMELGREL